MNRKINWTKQANGTYKKTLRGFTAVITILPSGKASVSINGGTAIVYDTRKQAQNSFEYFLQTKPVV